LALVTHPSQINLDYAQSKGVNLAIVPVVKGIFSGRITNWNQVGGPNGRIIALQRPEGSGSQSGMLRFMGDVPLMSELRAVIEESMGGLIERVGELFDPTESVIGYSYFYFANSMFVRDTIKMLGIDGVKPNAETLQSGEYPLVISYYADLTN
jgi:phosphate transport system substrate-binding protein